MFSIVRKFHKVWLLFITLSALGLIVAGCGGGSGSGGITLNYDGNTSQAAIDDGNGQVLASTALDGASNTGPLMTISAAKVDGTPSASAGPTIVKLVDVAHRIAASLASADTTAPSADAASARLVSGAGTTAGSCGGQMTVTNYNMGGTQTDLSITANVRYEQFCDTAQTDGATFDGNTSLSMSINSSGNMSVQVNFAPMTVTDGTESVTVDGSISLSADSMIATTMTATLNLKMRDDASGAVFWMENYQATIDASPGTYSLVTITGTFYHPVHGKVTVSTPVVLQFDQGSDYPSAGTLRLDGVGGSWVTLEAAPTTFTLTIFDGTNTTTVNGPWNQL